MQLTSACHGDATVLSALRRAIADEVLQGGNGAPGFREVTSSKTFHHRCTQFSCKYRIFTHRLFHTRPSGLTGEVKYWSVADMSTL